MKVGWAVASNPTATRATSLTWDAVPVSLLHMEPSIELLVRMVRTSAGACGIGPCARR
jgi:hypothetical protein